MAVVITKIRYQNNRFEGFCSACVAITVVKFAFYFCSKHDYAHLRFPSASPSHNPEYPYLLLSIHICVAKLYSCQHICIYKT